MITDIQVQHELLKTALEATDNYLFLEKRAVEANFATPRMLHDFTYELARAHDALQALGVLDKHQDYMETHVQTMLGLSGLKDKTIEELPYTHIPAADFGEVEENTILSFGQYILKEEKNSEETLSNEEIDKLVDDLTWEDIVDLYDDIELIYDTDGKEEIKEELLDESLTAQARLKKRQAFARMRGKRNTARNMKLRRASSINILKKRAAVAARRAIYQRFLRGRDKSTLSAAEKDRIEQQVSRMKYLQSAIATKMLPKMRSIEQKRLAGYRTKKSTAPGGTKPLKAPKFTKAPVIKK